MHTSSYVQREVRRAQNRPEWNRSSFHHSPAAAHRVLPQGRDPHVVEPRRRQPTRPHGSDGVMLPVLPGGFPQRLVNRLSSETSGRHSAFRQTQRDIERRMERTRLEVDANLNLLFNASSEDRRNMQELIEQLENEQRMQEQREAQLGERIRELLDIQARHDQTERDLFSILGQIRSMEDTYPDIASLVQHQSFGVAPAPPKSGMSPQRIQRLRITEGEVISEASAPCVICMESLSGSSSLYHLGCSHVFHKHCLAEWMRANTSCPMCRKEIA